MLDLTFADNSMSSGQVAKVFGVSAQTVGNWADGGHLPCSRTPGGHRRFRPIDVAVFFRLAGGGGALRDEASTASGTCDLDPTQARLPGSTNPDESSLPGAARRS